MHRDPEIYPRPREFIPERWLPDRRPSGFPEVPTNAFRAFEKGPRSCIGKELALLEMRIMAVLLLRRFDFSLAYEELDRRLDRKTPVTHDLPRCYTVLIGTGTPCDGMPVFVEERS
jgi:cytochrome P450